MLIFLGSFIPLVGLLVTGAFAVAIALLEHGFITTAVAVCHRARAGRSSSAATVIMSRSVSAPTRGGPRRGRGTTLGGIAGKLIAVPLAAFLNTTIRALRAGPGAASRKDLPIDESPSRASQGG